MTVWGFIDLLTDDAQKIELFGCNSGETLYEGWANDLPNEYGGMEILSIDTLFDPTTKLTLNVND